MIFYIAQAVGFIGMVLAFISFQKGNREGIILFQIMASFVFTLHFTLLGAYTGAILNIFGVLRNIVFLHREKSWANKKAWLYIFLLLFIISGLITYKNVYSLFPILGMCIASVALWMRNSKHTRFIVIFSSPCWLVYNIANLSYPGVLTESFVLISLTISIIRFDILKIPVKVK
jgi:hypothetical protein